jgi:hypothetical protein
LTRHASTVALACLWPLFLALAGAQCSAPAERSAPQVLASVAAGAERGPGPAVGEPVPLFELPDQDGRLRSLESLRGPKGLVLNFNRSVVW